MELFAGVNKVVVLVDAMLPVVKFMGVDIELDVSVGRVVTNPEVVVC